MGGKPTSRDEKEAIAARLAAMAGATRSPRPAAAVPPPRLPVPEPKSIDWEVRGAFRDSGNEAMLTINAPTQAAAEHEAMRHGLMVASCWPAQARTPQAAPVPTQPLGYEPQIPPPTPLAMSYPVLIEQTSKQWKWQIVMASLLAVGGLFGGCFLAPLAAAIHPGAGVVVVLLGLSCFVGGTVWAIVARFGAWWDHG